MKHVSGVPKNWIDERRTPNVMCIDAITTIRIVVIPIVKRGALCIPALTVIAIKIRSQLLKDDNVTLVSPLIDRYPNL